MTKQREEGREPMGTVPFSFCAVAQKRQDSDELGNLVQLMD